MTTNFGTINWLGGECQVRFNYGFINQGSGSFNIECDASFDSYYGGEYFNNYGLITKNSTHQQFTTFNLFHEQFRDGERRKRLPSLLAITTSTKFSVTGNFEVANNAEIAFNGGGYLTGAFTAAQGGLFNLEGGTFTNTPTTTFGGAGTSEFTGGTLTLIGNFIPNLQIAGGTVQPSPVFPQGGQIHQSHVELPAWRAATSSAERSRSTATLPVRWWWRAMPLSISTER